VTKFKKLKKPIHRNSQREKSFAWQILKGILRIGLLIVFLVGVYYVSRLAFFTINQIQIEGGETISHEVVRAVTETELEGTYFRLVPKRFAYSYPHDRINKKLNEIPRMYDVNVYRSPRDVLNISFKEYSPHALWCIEGSSATPCFFLDKTGYAFAPSQILQGGTLVRHFSTDATEITEGVVIDEEKLMRIDQFISQASEFLGFRITSLTHMQDEDIFMYINGGGELRISLTKDLDGIIENIIATLESDEFSHIEPGNFQYIDARFKNKLFINEEMATSTESIELTEPLPE